ncbi:MAG: tRNA pseudouridine(38-40) synthase TruA [Candidatus Cyclobacteriaceae bacterium M3_2C_046]
MQHRYFFELSYRGSNYCGWQIQNNVVSIQQVIERCLTILLKKPVQITASGRTDAGVHAFQQFFHADLDQELDQEAFAFRMNGFLPPDIAIQRIRRVKSDGHARFSAIDRSYQYHIHQGKDPFLNGMSYFYHRDLDLKAMNQAAQILLGKHDFSSFSKVKTQVSHFVCHISRAEWLQLEQRLVFYVTGNRFLRGMVRAMVGTLLLVGKRTIDRATFEQILKNKDRKGAGPSVPPEGLYLAGIRYPEDLYI